MNGAQKLLTPLVLGFLLAMAAIYPAIAATAIDDYSGSVKVLTYTLTVTEANGSVAKSPNQATYAPDTVVTLTANAGAGYHFIGWDGDLSGATNPAEITMTGNKSVTAFFALGPAPVNLRSAGNFAILAGSTITNTGPTIVNGNIGLYTGTSVTGFGPGIVNGTIFVAPSEIAAAAKGDLTTAFNDAAGRTLDVINVDTLELGGRTLAPGLYTSISSFSITSEDLTLDAQGDPSAVWIFQMPSSTLTVESDRKVILAGGAQYSNIYWQVGSSATLRTYSDVAGNIMAYAAITLETGATLHGRALAQIEAVTLDTNTVTKPAYQPDALIKRSTDLAYIGDNLYNILADQTATVTDAMIGVSQDFSVKFENDGIVNDSLLISGDGSGADYTVQYLDGANIEHDLTAFITGDGWTTPVLIPGDSVEVLVKITMQNGVFAGESRSAVLTAVSQGDDLQSDSAQATVTKAPVTSVSLTTDLASPRAADTRIILTADVTGGGGPMLYRFFTYKVGVGWVTIQAYSASNTCNWTPTATGSYTLMVYAKEDGWPDPARAGYNSFYQVYTTIPYTVVPTITAVTLTPSLTSPRAVQTSITLTAAANGGGTPLYRFFVNNGSGWTTIQAYSTANTCAWMPTDPGTYALMVYTKEQGWPDADKANFASFYQAFKTLTFTIVPKITAVTLSTNSPSPRLANTPITLTATPTGGAKVEYRFFQIYNGVSTTIQPYTLGANTFPVTPTELGQYQFIVWAREQGSPSGYDCYASVAHKVTLPLSAVSIVATPAWPQVPGATVTLKATPMNGGQVQYRFYVAEPGGPLQTVQAYGPSDTCLVTVTQQGIYQFLVYAREVGSNQAYDVYKSITYTCATPITGVTLAADPPSPGTVDSPITLSAQADGGFRVQYRYFVQPPGGAFATIQPYALEAKTCPYTPTAPGRYTFLVWVRETGSDAWNAYKTLTFMVE